MKQISVLLRCVLPLFTAVVFLTVVGCSNDGLGKRYAVKGTVTHKGTPVEKGEINFVPESAEGRAASGVITNGSYYLTTLTDGDGAMAGKYKVTVTSREVDLSKAQEKANSVGTGVALPQEFVAKAYKGAKNLIPTKYSLPSTTTLQGEVKEQSNKIDFDLTD